MFPEGDYEHRIKRNFQFNDQAMPPLCLEIIPSSSHADLQVIEETENKVCLHFCFLPSHCILMLNCRYQLRKLISGVTMTTDMKMKHDMKLYPPHTSIMAHSEKNQWATVTIMVKGIQNKQNTEIPFRISKQFGSLATSAPKVDSILQMKPHFNILYTTLCKSAAPKWEHIGSFLGVDPLDMDCIGIEKTGDLLACFREMIKVWLRQDPPPTKSKLLSVLRELEYNDEANKLK